MPRRFPLVRDGVVELPGGGTQAPQIRVDTTEWFAWLEQVGSFAFEDPAGRFTARKKRRANGTFWYAIAEWGGRNRERYLGKSEAVSLAALQAMAVGANARSRPSARRESVAETARHESPVVRTKLVVPSVSPATVLMSRALERLMRVWDAPVTVIRAPAGFGKTTLAASWVAHAELLATWVSLDARDNDPVAFWSNVAAALGQYAPGLEDLVRTALASTPSAQPAVIAAMIIAGLTHTTRDLALVLDGYDYLSPDNTAIHDGVIFLVEHMPYSVHLVFVARTDPPLPLAAWRVSQPLIELSPADLVFSREETARYLTDVMDLALNDDELDALYAETEGWLIALQLAALAIREQPYDTAAVIGSLGENADIVAYVVEQVADRLPDRTRDVLAHVILLERLNADVCDAVTQSHDGSDQIAAVQRAHLFLRRETGILGWYRFHGIFAAALRHYVRTSQPEVTASVYHLASAWSERHGYVYDAIEYALASGESERAAGLLDGAVEPALEQGTATVIAQQIGRLPDTLVRKLPRLSVAHAHALFMSGDRIALLQCVVDAETALAAGYSLPDPQALALLQAEVQVLRAAVQFALVERSPRSILASLQQALAVLPAHHAYHSFATIYLGCSQILLGALRQSQETFAALFRAAEARDDRFYLSVAGVFLGLGAIFSGRLNDALEVARRARSLLGPLADTGWGSGTHLVTGRVLYERNDLERARAELVLGHQMIWEPLTRIFEGMTYLAQVYLAQGDRATALATMEEALAEWTRAEVRQRLVWKWTGALIEASQARLWLLLGEVTSTSDWARGLAPAPRHGSPAQSRSKPRYVLEAEQLVLARLSLAEGEPESAIEVLEQLSRTMARDGWVERLIEVYTLQAVAYDALHEQQLALDALRRALELAAGERFMRVFLEGGTPIQRLLMVLLDADSEPAEWRERRDIDALRRFMASLLSAFAGDSAATSGTRRTSDAGLAEPAATASDEALAVAREVTPRELQVLELVLQGARNKDIARALGISASTTKHHVQRLFRKLDVQSRAQAIARAMALRLLDHAKQLQDNVRRAQDVVDQMKGTVGPPHGAGPSSGPIVPHAYGGEFST